MSWTAAIISVKDGHTNVREHHTPMFNELGRAIIRRCSHNSNAHPQLLECSYMMIFPQWSRPPAAESCESFAVRWRQASVFKRSLEACSKWLYVLGHERLNTLILGSNPDHCGRLSSQRRHSIGHGNANRERCIP